MVVGGGVGTVLCSSLWCSKRLLVVQSAHEEDEGHPDMSCKKNSTENYRPTDHRGAREHIYIQILQREREKKKVFTPVQRSKPVCYLEKKAPPCLSSTGLLASMHAWQVHADIYTVLWGGHNSKGGRRRGCWAVPLK